MRYNFNSQNKSLAIWSAVATLLVILFVFAAIAGAPLALIWAVNTLFGLKIAYTLLNWLAAAILIALSGSSFSSSFSSKNKDKS